MRRLIEKSHQGGTKTLPRMNADRKEEAENQVPGGEAGKAKVISAWQIEI